MNASEDARTVLTAAFAAADKLNHRYIGTEHLLVGVAAEGTASAVILGKIGLRPQDVRSEVLAILGHDGL